jgi:hypothetical protein
LSGAACPALGRMLWQGSPRLTAGPGAPCLGWRERRALSGVERGLVEQTVTAKGVDRWGTGTLLHCTALTQGERFTEIHGNQQVTSTSETGRACPPTVCTWELDAPIRGMYDTWISGSDVNSFGCYGLVYLLDSW